MFKTVILAAGQGKRMFSDTPKVLHFLAGKSLLQHVADTVATLTTESPIIVFGHQGQLVKETLPNTPATWVEQKEQLGTGHALLQALPHIPDGQRVLVLYGDVPLINASTLKNLLNTPENSLGLITANVSQPAGLGRIVRDAQNKIIDIIEEKDTTETQRAISEINSGIYYIPKKFLSNWLPALTNNNSQKEYYLTDIIRLAVKEHIPIYAVKPSYEEEILGVNDKIQLAHLERFFQKKLAEKLMQQGTTLADPTRIDIRGSLTVGKDIFIDVNVIFEGNVILGNRCQIGANSILKNVILGDDVEIKPHSVIEGAEINQSCVIGPFARIRPGTTLAANVHVGNFAEIKNSFIGENTKIHHVSYTGDSTLGKKVNIGAGTIVCNYDGVNKYRTTIEDGAFIGSNSSLVAPVNIGAGAIIGAGSIINRDAPPHQLTLARAQQTTIEGWKRRNKEGES